MSLRKLFFAIIFPGFIFSFCSSPVLNNPEDGRAESFLFTQLIKCVLNNRCGAGSGPIYSESSYTLYRLAGVDSIIPNNSSEIVSCTSSPSLPLGLSLDSNCTISGTPTVLRSKESYTIYSVISGKSGSSTIQLEVVSLGGNAVGLIRTNQNLCYNASASISCGDVNFPKQDADFRYHLARGYEDKGNDTILDTTTGLIWGKCSLGSSGASCAVGGSTYSYSNAATSCQAAGMRVPTVYELSTLMDHGVSSTPLIDGVYFPGTVTGTPYWTSTDDLATAGNKMTISFQTGSADTSTTGATARYVRCVSGDSISPSFSYMDMNNGTIKDKFTKLIWQKCSYGQTYPGCTPATPTTRTWQQALNDCNSLSLEGRAWRLPNKNELLSLWNYARTGTGFLLDPSFFPNLGTLYWSSTTNSNSGSNTNVFVAYSSTGVTNQFGKSGAYAVRCVSGP